LPDDRHSELALTQQQLRSLWNDLLADDAPVAYQAVWQLVRGRAVSVPFLMAQLKQLPEPGLERIPSLLSELDSDQFRIRKRATTELEKLGEFAEPALRQILRQKPSLEVRRRVEKLLYRMEDGALGKYRMSIVRAVAALEHIAGPQGCKALQELSSSQRSDSLPAEAKEALERLARRARVQH
jgi:hypothetical protein